MPVLKYSGQLAVLTLAPLGFALMDSEWSSARRYAVVGSALFLAGGWVTRLPVPARIQRPQPRTPQFLRLPGSHPNGMGGAVAIEP